MLTLLLQPSLAIWGLLLEAAHKLSGLWSYPDFISQHLHLLYSSISPKCTPTPDSASMQNSLVVFKRSWQKILL